MRLTTLLITLTLFSACREKAKQKLAATGTNRNRRPGGGNLFSWETTLYDL